MTQHMYTLAQLRNGTGFPAGAMFVQVEQQTVFVVDEDGGTWVSLDKAEAEAVAA